MAIGLSSYEEKTSADHAEDVKVDGRYDAMKVHGDRGLALVGGERIPLTDEDVCCISSRLVQKRLYDVPNRVNVSAERLTKSSLLSLSGFTSSRYTSPTRVMRTWLILSRSSTNQLWAMVPSSACKKTLALQEINILSSAPSQPSHN